MRLSGIALQALTLLSLVLLLGCATDSPTTNVEQDIAAIEEMFDARFEAFITAPDPAAQAEAYFEYVTDDAWWMPPGEPVVRGKEEIRTWVESFFRSFTLDVDEHRYETPEVGSTLAVRRFTAVGRYIPRSGGDPIPFSQKYIDVLRKQPDGSWKLSLHTWSTNDALPSIWDPHHELFFANLKAGNE